MNIPPVQAPFDEEGRPSRQWIEWAQNISANSKFKGSSTTASRPINGLTDGDTYLDTSLGYTITYYNGDWIDSTGSTV